jgi:hypothetical protein
VGGATPADLRREHEVNQTPLKAIRAKATSSQIEEAGKTQQIPCLA